MRAADRLEDECCYLSRVYNRADVGKGILGPHVMHSSPVIVHWWTAYLEEHLPSS